MVFDVGGTEIKYSVMDEDLRVHASGHVPTPMDSREAFYQTLEDLRAPYKEETAGAAVSLPGFIDIERGFVAYPGALSYNRNAFVGPELSERLGCPVRIANDGKCAAMAEYWKGALKGCVSGTVLIFGTGVGGGLIVNGRLVNGVHFTAGEFSFLHHHPADWNNIREMMACRCSTPALLSRYKALKGLPEDSPLDGREFFARYHGGDDKALEALEGFALDAAGQIYNMTVLLDLEVIAIGGGISRQDAVIEKVREKVNGLYASGPNAATGFPMRPPRVERCRFGSEANQVGALYLYRLSEGRK